MSRERGSCGPPSELEKKINRWIKRNYDECAKDGPEVRLIRFFHLNPEGTSYGIDWFLC